MYEEINTMGAKVGKIIDIDGPRLMYTRKFLSGQIGTYQAYPGMVVYLNDHFKADDKTSGAIEFTIGGQANVSRSTEVVVTGQRDITVVGNQFAIKAGKVWQKIDKQKSQVQIQTAGAMGIEG